jgi:hypothetical protein
MEKLLIRNGKTVIRLFDISRQPMIFADKKEVGNGI